jgi:hypothetical protein
MDAMSPLPIVVSYDQFACSKEGFWISDPNLENTRVRTTASVV